MTSRPTLLRFVGLALVLLLLVALLLMDRTDPERAASDEPTSTPTPAAEPTETGFPSAEPTKKPKKPKPVPEFIKKRVCVTKPKTKTIRVMSFNTHRSFGGIGTIAAEIRDVDPDVVLLQEIDRFYGRTGFVDQPAYFASQLDMESAFMANVRQGKGEYGVAILSRFPIVRQTELKLPWAPGSEPRGLLGVRLKVGRERVHVFNTHLQNKMEGLRALQAQTVAESLDSIEDPMILGGDMNTTATNSAMGPLMARLQDSFGQVGTGAPGTGPGDSRIDLLLASASLTPVTSYAARSSISDHARVISDFVIPQPKKCKKKMVPNPAAKKKDEDKKKRRDKRGKKSRGAQHEA